MNEKEIAQFIQFYYPEIKELTLKFLTLVTTVFTVSMVFAEKFVFNGQGLSRRHAPLLLSWILFFFALALGGFGLYQLFMAAEVAHGQIVYEYHADLRSLMRSVYGFLDVAGMCFGLGLIGLAYSALRKLISPKTNGEGKMLPNKANSADAKSCAAN